MSSWFSSPFSRGVFFFCRRFLSFVYVPRGEAASDRTGVSIPSLAVPQLTTPAIRIESALGRSKYDQCLQYL